MDDLQTPAQNMQTPPEQAATNIQTANQLGIQNPDYVARNPSWNEKAAIQRTPAKAEPVTAAYMDQSGQNAALASKDIDHLNWFEKQGRMISDYFFDRPSVNNDIVDLVTKQINNGGDLSADDEIHLMNLNKKQSDLEEKDYGLKGPLNKIPAMIAQGFSDVGRSIYRGALKGQAMAGNADLSWDDPDLMEKKNAGSAAVLYGIGVKEPFDNLTAGTYNTLSNETKDDGTPLNMNHDDKLALSRGVGVVGTLLMHGTGYVVAEGAPFLKPFVGGAIKPLITNPTRAAVLMAIGNGMKGVIAASGAAGATHVSSLIAQELAKAKGTGEDGFWNAMGNVANKIGSNTGGQLEQIPGGEPGQFRQKEGTGYRDQVLAAAGQGAATGVAIEAPIQILGLGYSRQRFKEGFDKYRSEPRDVTPGGDPALPPGPSDEGPGGGQRSIEAPKRYWNPDDIKSGTPVDDVIDITPNDTGAPTNEHEDSIKTVQMHEALSNMGDVINDTKMSELSPEEKDKYVDKVLTEHGIKTYVTLDDLRKFSNNDKKGYAARVLVDPSKVAAGQMNQPIEVPAYKVLAIYKDFPDILDHVRYQPGGKNVISATEDLQARQRAHEQRGEVTKALGIEPDDNASGLPADSDSATPNSQLLKSETSEPQPQRNKYNKSSDGVLPFMEPPKDKSEELRQWAMGGKKKSTDEQPLSNNFEDIHNKTKELLAQKKALEDEERGFGPADDSEYKPDLPGLQKELADLKVKKEKLESQPLKKLDMDKPTPDEAVHAFHAILSGSKPITDLLDMRPEGVTTIKKSGDMDTLEELIKAVQNKDHPTPNDYLKILQLAIEKKHEYMGAPYDYHSYRQLEKSLNAMGYELPLSDEIKNKAKSDTEARVKNWEVRLRRSQMGVAGESQDKMSPKVIQQIIDDTKAEGAEEPGKPFDKHLNREIRDYEHDIGKLQDIYSRRKAIDAQIEELKGQVTEHLKDKPHGSLLSFPFDEKSAAEKFEMKFGREPTFTDALRTVLPEEQIAKFNEAVLGARQHTVNLVHDQAVHEMDHLIDQTKAMAEEERKQEELERISNDPNFKVLDQFHQAPKIPNTNLSIYTIDPRSLSDDLITYIDNYMVKQHKIFNKKGRPISEVAGELGFENPLDLLDVFASTPPRSKILKARAKFYEADNYLKASDSVDLNHTAIMKAFADKKKAYLETMRFLKDNDWSQTKIGFQLISLPLPKIEEIDNWAHEEVRKMKYKDLDPRVFAVGERRSYREAINKFLAGDIAGAFAAKERAMRNAAMQAEVRKAIGSINRAQKFVRFLKKPAPKTVIARSPKSYRDGLDEILDVFNLDPSKKGKGKDAAYAKFVAKMLGLRRGSFQLPDNTQDIRQSIDDMSVETIVAVGNAVRALYKEMQQVTELIKNEIRKREEESIDRVRQRTVLESQDHNGSRGGGMGGSIQRPEGDTIWDSIKGKLLGAEVALLNMEHILRYYDMGKMNGFFQETFMHPIKGDGKYHNKSGYSMRQHMITNLATRMRSIMDQHGDYDNVEKKLIMVPEFRDHKDLNSGWMSRGDLMTLWSYMGDPGGKDRMLKNFRDSQSNPIPEGTWQKVFDRELEVRDVVAMQQAVDMYKDYQAATRDLQLRDRGEDVQFIEGIPVQHKGKWYPGGYVHLNYKSDWEKKAITQQLENMKSRAKDFYEGNSSNVDYGRQYAGEQTEQGRLQNRTGKDDPLDYSLLRFWRGHEEVIHDLCYREAVKNTLKLLRDKTIRAEMIKMGGKARYRLVVSTIIEIAGQIEEANMNYFADQNRFFKDLFKGAQSHFAQTVLAANLYTSAPIQIVSVFQLSANMGVKGQKHLAFVLGRMTKDPFLYRHYMEFGREIDPTIGHFHEEVFSKVNSQIHSFVPQRRRAALKLGDKAIMFPKTPIGKSYTWLMHKAMGPMEWVDTHMKVVGAFASYSQFMAGDADNWPKAKVDALDPKERHAQAIAYSRQISRLSLTHALDEDKAAFQKLAVTMLFSNFLNDARNVLGNTINIGYQKPRWSMEDASQKLGQSGSQGLFDPSGNHPSLPAFKDAAVAAGLVMSIFLQSSADRWLTDKIRGIQQTPGQMHWDFLKNKDHLPTARDQKQALDYVMFSPFDQLFTVTGFTKDIFFAEQMPDKVIRGFVDRKKTVQIPMTKMMSDMATAINLMVDAKEQTKTLTDFFWHLTHLSDTETKALLDSSSYIIPWPANAYEKTMKALQQPYNSPRKAPVAIYNKLEKAVGAYLKRQEGPNKIAMGGEFDDETRKFHQELQTKKPLEIPQNFEDDLKVAMSGADWSQPGGLYGFSEERWNYIRENAPELGLTESGRLEQKSDQQEKAASWVIRDDAKKLQTDGVPVNHLTLYMSFKMGETFAKDLFNADAKEQLTKVLGKDFIEKNPEFAQYKTVGQAKQALTDEFTKAIWLRKQAKELTSTTKPTEDKL